MTNMVGNIAVDFVSGQTRRETRSLAFLPLYLRLVAASLARAPPLQAPLGAAAEK